MAQTKNSDEFERREFANRKREEMSEFQLKRNALTERLPCQPELFQSYLEVQTRLMEAPMNTLWIASVLPDVTVVHSFEDWKKLGERVKDGAQGIPVISGQPWFDNRTKKKALMWRLVKVYDVRDLEKPKEDYGQRERVDYQSFCYMLSKKEDWPEDAKELMVRLIPESMAKDYVLSKYPEQSYLNLITNSIAYMIAYKFLDREIFENAYLPFEIDPSDLNGYSYLEINQVLKVIKDGFVNINNYMLEGE